MSARRVAIRTACKAASLPLYAADLRTVRGKCLAKRCRSRWGVVRISLDFRDDRVTRLATLECATCGRVWRRVAVPPLRSPAGYQAVRLELILPGDSHRWRSRGRWHVEGADAVIVREADLGDLDEAARAHTARADRHADTLARARAKREAADLEASAAAADLMARLASRDAERREAEAEAARRDA